MRFSFWSCQRICTGTIQILKFENQQGISNSIIRTTLVQKLLAFFYHAFALLFNDSYQRLNLSPGQIKLNCNLFWWEFVERYCYTRLLLVFFCFKIILAFISLSISCISINFCSWLNQTASCNPRSLSSIVTTIIEILLRSKEYSGWWGNGITIAPYHVRHWKNKICWWK